MNREEWLQLGVRCLAPLVFKHDLEQTIKVSCGWPSTKARAASGKRIGECWSTECSAEGVNQIFISPLLHDSREVLAVLTHELVHAAVGVECGHRGAFVNRAKQVGLEGKPTATYAGKELEGKLSIIVESIGLYPHEEFTPSDKEQKKQSTRMIKLECRCGYVARTTRKWIAVGVPTCCCGGEFEVDGLDEDESENGDG